MSRLSAEKVNLEGFGEFDYSVFISLKKLNDLLFQFIKFCQLKHRETKLVLRSLLFYFYKDGGISKIGFACGRRFKMIELAALIGISQSNERCQT